MIGLFAGIALAASVPFNCAPFDQADVIVERRAIALGGNQQLEAISISRHGDGALGFDSSRLVIYSTGCRMVFEQRFDGTTETHFKEGYLGGQPVLVVTALEPGGSGCGYQHVVLAYRQGDILRSANDVVALAPMDLGHSNMDGFYVGDLGRRRGAGVTLWEALWEGGSHYDPHRYRVVTYRWLDGRFVGPTVTTTRRKYPPVPNKVAERLGFTFRDATEPERFTLTFDHGKC